MLLPIKQCAANGAPMHFRLVLLFAVLALLVGGVFAPSAAFAESAFAPDGAAVVAMVEQSGDDGSDDGKQRGDVPCHAVSHHHCSAAVAVDSSALNLGFVLSDVAMMPLADSTMSSFSRAPPTEPPAA